MYIEFHLNIFHDNISVLRYGDGERSLMVGASVSVTGISFTRNRNCIAIQSSEVGKSIPSPIDIILIPASRRSSSSTSPLLVRLENLEKSLTIASQELLQPPYVASIILQRNPSATWGRTLTN